MPVIRILEVIELKCMAGLTDVHSESYIVIVSTKLSHCFKTSEVGRVRRVILGLFLSVVHKHAKVTNSNVQKMQSHNTAHLEQCQHLHSAICYKN